MPNKIKYFKSPRIDSEKKITLADKSIKRKKELSFCNLVVDMKTQIIKDYNFYPILQISFNKRKGEMHKKHLASYKNNSIDTGNDLEVKNLEQKSQQKLYLNQKSKAHKVPWC